METLITSIDPYMGPGVLGINGIILFFIQLLVRKITSLTEQQQHSLTEQTKMTHLVAGIEGNGGILNQLKQIESEIARNQKKLDDAITKMTDRLNRHHDAITHLQNRLKITDTRLKQTD